MNIEKEQKYNKKINSLSDWKEFCLESKYPNFHTINLMYLHPFLSYEHCIITLASVTITNSISTLVYYDYIEINDNKYLIGNEYSSLNRALFYIVLAKCLPDHIRVQLDYCRRIYFQSNEPFHIYSKSYFMSLLCYIKQFQLPVSSIELEIKQITEEENWELFEIIKVYASKMPNYGDYNSTLYYIFLATWDLIFMFKPMLIIMILKIILL
jgi:hypothetical protein